MGLDIALSILCDGIYGGIIAAVALPAIEGGNTVKKVTFQEKGAEVSLFIPSLFF
jgi:hypothetical protein